MKIKLSILIPAYNEGSTVHLILDKVRDVVLPDGITKEIIIVNDFSSDNTVEKIEDYKSKNPELGIQLFSQQKNKGKGAVLRF
jgi:glycosyltransferase involved in cell wall biosynthesis